MANFAFRSSSRGDDEDRLMSKGEARRLVRHAKKLGHNAKVESSGPYPSEHRVRIDKPSTKGVAYLTKGDMEGSDGQIKPHFVDDV